MSSRGLMKRTHSPLLSLWPVLTFACYSGSDAGGGPVDLGTTASTSPTSASTDPPTTSLPTTSATSSTSTGTLTDTTSTGPGSGSSTGAPDTSGAEPGTSSSGTTELPPSQSCGDAILDPGEECDLGAAQNDDQEGACTLTCKLPKCGDHLIWAGKEDCDNGDNNNDVLYGGCTTQCKYGPRCGDAKLQDSEECDLGPDNGNGEFLPDSVPCTGGCRFKAKLVFLSSVAYMAGELKTAEDADVECQKLAAKAKFDNAPSFKAWISDASHSPAKDFTKTAGLPYVRPDGVRIADDWDDLILNGPDDGITVTETGVALLSTGVWTGTGPNGQLVPETLTCKGWSSSEAVDKGQRGLSGVEKKLGPAWTQWVDNDHWTTYLISSCIFPYHLYCFER